MKNLISLGVLDFNALNYNGEGGVIRVSKDALGAMNGIKKGSLYVVKGNTIVGIAALVQYSGENESSLTRL